MMDSKKFYRKFILPAVVPLTAVVITLTLIVCIGELLLHLKVHDASKEYERIELWTAVGIALVILGGCAFLSTRPAGSLGKFDEELAIGSRPMLAPPLPPVDVQARRGAVGTVKDLQPGFTLYARNGALAKVVEVLPTAQEEFGHLRTGLIFAQGVHGASDEMWIPGEAVSAVYPETHSAFLAIAGDEIEFLGWHRPPSSFRRTPRTEAPKLY
jgi:hypothetical protein